MRVVWAALTILVLTSGISLAADNELTVTFDVQEMTCATCPIAVRKAIERVDGVTQVEVSLDDHSAVVTFDSSATTAAAIGQASTDVGFPATVREER
ncbi:MAG: cation transporter [Gammaproteobacteria bacterium]|jgi:mercuric ion binding protein|nr:cation transporter [Gammaproteobacteria bacterium]